MEYLVSLNASNWCIIHVAHLMLPIKVCNLSNKTKKKKKLNLFTVAEITYEANINFIIIINMFVFVLFILIKVIPNKPAAQAACADKGLRIKWLTLLFS